MRSWTKAMPVFDYRAYNSSGKELAGTIEAPSAKEALESLKKDGLYPKGLSVSGGNKGAFFSAKRRVSLVELAVFTRQLSTLIGAGTALYEALGILSAEEENRTLASAIISVKETVSGGASLSKALSAHPSIFSEMYVRTVEAAEAGGTLEGALKGLADYSEARARVIGRVKAALIYPAVMTAVGFMVLLFLFIFVLPKITAIFADTRQALPLSTSILLFIMNALKSWWHLIAAAGIGAWWGLRSWARRPGGKAFFDRLLLRLPAVGRLAVKFYMAGFARTLGSLLKSGVPMLLALEMTRKVLDHAVYEGALSKAVKDVTEGVALSTSLKSTGAFPGVLTHMISTGERSGELAGLLLKASESYDREFEGAVDKALTLLEPAVILVMGAIVGFIVLSILLPIFELNQIAG